jgi:hypothetical protein
MFLQGAVYYLQNNGTGMPQLHFVEPPAYLGYATASTAFNSDAAFILCFAQPRLLDVLGRNVVFFDKFGSLLSKPPVKPCRVAEHRRVCATLNISVFDA